MRTSRRFLSRFQRASFFFSSSEKSKTAVNSYSLRDDIKVFNA
ncbi:hypothetical protein PLG01_01341 [Streptococcus mutans PKUSS-LG01]|nr:hypothetical protein PLG01_01341 [Streptococcus mutans PKUSS-LG01]